MQIAIQENSPQFTKRKEFFVTSENIDAFCKILVLIAAWQIIETDSLMEHVVSSLSDTNARVRLSAVRCLHSLSRSVQQLRTTFQDHAVWRPLMRLLHNAPDDILLVASSTLCNLLLEFSPSKEVGLGLLAGCPFPNLCGLC